MRRYPVRSDRTAASMMAGYRRDTSKARTNRLLDLEKARLDAMTPEERASKIAAENAERVARDARLADYRRRCNEEAALAKAEGRPPRKIN